MANINKKKEVIEGQIFKPQPMALEGIRVIDLTIIGAGPVATKLLGQLGAEILKIEEPGVGDQRRYRDPPPGVRPGAVPNLHFEDNNSNKKSVTIDLNKEKGQEILHQLVAKSDVFTTNLRPQALKRFKVDYETLVKYNPKLVYVRGNVFGPNGPDANRPGNAQHGEALGGLMTLHPYFDTLGPMRNSGGGGDMIHALAMAYGVLAALIARDRLGIGQEVTLSQLSAVMNLLVLPPLAQELGWGMHTRLLPREKTPALFNWYKCKDGKWMMLAMIAPQGEKKRFDDWHRLCIVMGKPELENDPRFKDLQIQEKNKEALRKILDVVFLTKTRAEWDAAFRQAGVVWYSPINEVGDLVDDPQVLANHYIWEVDHPKYGKIKWPGHIVTFTKTPATVRSFAPEVGQDTEAVLMDLLGYSRDELAKLKEERVISPEETKKAEFFKKRM